MKTAFLVGTTGLVGSALLEELLRMPEYGRVVSFGRRAVARVDPKLVQHPTDLVRWEGVAAGESCDDAFCCLGTTRRQAGSAAAFRAVDHAAVVAFAWAARQRGAQRCFVVSSLGANPRSRLLYPRVKGEMEEALGVLGFSLLAIFRPSFLAGRRERRRFGERVATAALWPIEPLLVGPLRRYRSIHRDVVARAMARVALGDARGRLVLESDEIQQVGGYGATA